MNARTARPGARSCRKAPNQVQSSILAGFRNTLNEFEGNMISSLSRFRKGTTHWTGVRRVAAFFRAALVSGPLAAGVLAAALAVFPPAGRADEVMSVTRDQIGIGKTDPSGKGDDLFLTTPPGNVNGTTQQGWDYPGYPMPEVQVYVPWYGPGPRPPHPGPRPPYPGPRPPYPGPRPGPKPPYPDPRPHPDGHSSFPGRQPPSQWGQHPPQWGQPPAPGQRPRQWGQPENPGQQPPRQRGQEPPYGPAPYSGQNPPQWGQPPASGQQPPYSGQQQPPPPGQRPSYQWGQPPARPGQP